jgi:rhodanese-related sulfurtransferase
MKRYIVAATMVLSLVSCGEAQTKKDSNSSSSVEQISETNYKVVSQTEFKTLIKAGKGQLLDVRTPSEFNAGHIKTADNIDFTGSYFREKVAKLDREKPVLIYCHSGNRSGKASLILKELGFKEVYDLQGGYSNWNE